MPRLRRRGDPLTRWVLALAAQLRRRAATPGRAGEDGELDHQDELALRRDLAAAHDRERALVADVRQLEARLDGDAEADRGTLEAPT